MTAIDDKYTALGGSNGFLGSPTTPETTAPDQQGKYRHYQHGSIYWSSATGAHEVHGAIRDLWSSMGWERSLLGYPMNDETATANGVGRCNHFQHGSIYWTSQTGAHEVHGAIRHKWIELGWERSILGYPTSNETATPDGSGRYNHFQYGSIYWSAGTGAFEVHGAIRNKWSALGWERSLLHYPLTDERTTPDGVGRYNHFQSGSIYWSPTTGAHEVHGAIRTKWSQLGWERSILGYPLTDETVTPDRVGRYNHFQSGSIYWTPSTGAFEVHGAIRERWQSMGWERSWLGYPTSDERVTQDGVGRYNRFQHGSIYWTPTTGAYPVREIVRVHAKVLTTPNIAIADLLAAMRRVYADAEIGVELASTEVLNLPALNDLDVGSCAGSTTAEQNELFTHRNNAGANDVVVYFIRSTNPPYNGCASHPTNQPGAVCVQTASQWTFAHEIGHVLGLAHVTNNDRLMTGNGTFNITNAPPDLTVAEKTTMLNSPYTV